MAALWGDISFRYLKQFFLVNSVFFCQKKASMGYMFLIFTTTKMGIQTISNKTKYSEIYKTNQPDIH
jgi:hypothetical protein